MMMSFEGARPTDADSCGTPTIRPANGPVSNVSFAGAAAATWSAVTEFSASVSFVAAACGGCHAGMIEVAASASAFIGCGPLPCCGPPAPPGQATTVEPIAAAGGTVGAAGAGGCCCAATGCGSGAAGCWPGAQVGSAAGAGDAACCWASQPDGGS